MENDKARFVRVYTGMCSEKGCRLAAEMMEKGSRLLFCRGHGHAAVLDRVLSGTEDSGFFLLERRRRP